MSKLFVVRGERPEGFVMVPNEVVRPNGTMSMQAVGLLAHLLSHDSGNWTVSTESLTAAFSNGIQGTRAAIRELEEHGYLVRVRRNTPGGFVHTWTVYERPDLRFTDSDNRKSSADYKSPSYGNPSDGCPSDGNRAGIKKTSSSEDQIEKTRRLSGSSATPMTDSDFSAFARFLETEVGEYRDPHAIYDAMRRGKIRDPFAFARDKAKLGQLDGYLANLDTGEDEDEEPTVVGVAFDPWGVL